MVTIRTFSFILKSSLHPVWFFLYPHPFHYSGPFSECLSAEPPMFRIRILCLFAHLPAFVPRLVNSLSQLCPDLCTIYWSGGQVVPALCLNSTPPHALSFNLKCMCCIQPVLRFLSLKTLHQPKTFCWFTLRPVLSFLHPPQNDCEWRNRSSADAWWWQLPNSATLSVTHSE